MRAAAITAAVLVASAAAAAGYANQYVLDTTVAFEDIAPGSDRDQNDVVVRYNQRCRVTTPAGQLVHQELHVTPVAAGARLLNELWVELPGAPTLVTLSIGGGPADPVCSGACPSEVLLLDDFRDGFVDPPVGFVNTEGGTVAVGRELVLYAEYGNPVPLGSVTCPAADLQIRRPGVVIDGTSVLPNTQQPMRAELPGDWSVPEERVPLSVAYGQFMTWLTATLGGCAPGACPAEDWYLDPAAGTVIVRDLSATAPLDPQATCADGVANQDETDVDCGGAFCPACDVGDTCDVGADCATGVCGLDDTCAASSCSDGVWNGLETDLDCGGPNCGDCGNGFACASGGDCTSGYCGVGVDGSCATSECFSGTPGANGAVLTCVTDDDGVYQVQTFHAGGGLRTFTPPATVTEVEVLVVGGGGGGGGSQLGLGGGGGGGAGGLKHAFQTVVPGTGISVQIGGGGGGGSGNNGGNGGQSAFGATVALGGGGGGRGNGSGGANGGGSGGGAGYNGYSYVGGAPGSVGQGFSGGANLCSNHSAGGGGAGGAGQDHGSMTNCGSGYGRGYEGGYGGQGLTYDISGVGVTYAVGGNGTVGGTDGQAGTAHRGNGGHGVYASANSGTGGAGGSGVVIVRYLDPLTGATCSDGLLNGAETDIDCGGPFCGGCGLAEACLTVTDCASGWCGPGLDGTCGTSVCFDGTPEANGGRHLCTTEGGYDYDVWRFDTVGTTTFTPPAGVSAVEVLVVAGGGGGGGSAPSLGGGGGGGGGGVRYVAAQAVTPGAGVSVKVGAGGTAGNNSAGGQGHSSWFGTVTTVGGGGGGSGSSGSGVASSGGSGGGAGYNGYSFQWGAAGTAGQGYAGGKNLCSNYAAGGGGAGGFGANQGAFVACGSGGGRDVVGGLGGRGLRYRLSGVWAEYGQGGDGSGASLDGVAGGANTGDGGSGTYGGANGNVGAAGGSGIVIVRYPTP